MTAKHIEPVVPGSGPAVSTRTTVRRFQIGLGTLVALIPLYILFAPSTPHERLLNHLKTAPKHEAILLGYVGFLTFFASLSLSSILSLYLLYPRPLDLFSSVQYKLITLKNCDVLLIYNTMIQDGILVTKICNREGELTISGNKSFFGFLYTITITKSDRSQNIVTIFVINNKTFGLDIGICRFVLSSLSWRLQS